MPGTMQDADGTMKACPMCQPHKNMANAAMLQIIEACKQRDEMKAQVALHDEEYRKGQTVPWSRMDAMSREVLALEKKTEETGRRYVEMAKELESDRDRLQAEVDRMREGLESIRIFSTDTLSGRVDGPDDREWQRAAVNEIAKRARAALHPSVNDNGGKVCGEHGCTDGIINRSDHKGNSVDPYPCPACSNNEVTK